MTIEVYEFAIDNIATLSDSELDRVSGGECDCGDANKAAARLGIIAAVWNDLFGYLGPSARLKFSFK